MLKPIFSLLSNLILSSVVALPSATMAIAAESQPITVQMAHGSDGSSSPINPQDKYTYNNWGVVYDDLQRYENESPADLEQAVLLKHKVGFEQITKEWLEGLTISPLNPLVNDNGLFPLIDEQLSSAELEFSKTYRLPTKTTGLKFKLNWEDLERLGFYSD